MISRKSHGVITARRHGMPDHVVNIISKKRTANNKIRLDKLIRSEYPRILIKRRLGGIGDVIMSTPLLKHIKRLIPNCELTYATDLKYSWGALGEVIKHNPYVDRLIHNGEFKESDYDYSVDITATGLSREKAGSIPPNRIDMFAEEVGVDVSSDPQPDWIVTKEEEKDALEFLDSYIPEGKRRKDYKLIMIQCRSNDARRTWPLKHVDTLADMLAKDENHIIFLMEWGAQVNQWKDRTRVNIIKDQPLKETAAFMQQCDLVICPDSALLHLAGALNKKTLSIFGPIPPQSRINHYPNCSVVYRKLPCSFCVVGESKLLSSTGYKKIKDIKEGDLVLTNSGKLRQVIKNHKNKRKNRQLLELDVFGSADKITLTDEHKILISKKSYSYKKEYWSKSGTKKRRRMSILSEPEWVKAKDIKKMDYCCYPIPEEIEPTNELLKSKDLAWLVGLFVAEGWSAPPKHYSRAYSVKLAISNKEHHIEQRVREIIKENDHVFYSGKQNKGFINVYKNSRGESNIISISNKRFLTILNDLFEKKETENINLKNKYIPQQLINAPIDIIKSFLLGLFEGDGHRGLKEDIYTTSKRDLAYGIQILFLRLGQLAKIYERKRDTNFKKDTTIFRIYASRNKEWKRWYKKGNYILAPIKDIKRSEREDEFVWDISVKEDPTFTINNISIFDCWYTPKCHQNTTSKLECLTKLMPKTVCEAAINKLKAPDQTMKSIKYGADLTSKGQDNIILVKRAHGGMGDVLMTGPALKALKTKYPDKKIHYAIPTLYHDMMSNLPFIDKVQEVNKPINDKRYFMVMDISHPDSRYESTRITAGKTVEKSRVEIYAEALGVRNLMTEYAPIYQVEEKETEWASLFLKSQTIDNNKPIVGVQLESAEEYRNYPKDKFKRLFELLGIHFNVIMFGAESKEKYINVIDACALPIRRLASVMSLCDVIISVDTGPLHLAAALEIPTVALFGPIDYKARCKGYKNTIAVVSELSCVPCWRNCNIACKQTGSTKGNSLCMQNIPPTVIANIAKQKLETNSISMSSILKETEEKNA